MRRLSGRSTLSSLARRAPPPNPSRNSPEGYVARERLVHGCKLSDEWSWLEDPDYEGTIRYLEEENTYATKSFSRSFLAEDTKDFAQEMEQSRSDVDCPSSVKNGYEYIEEIRNGLPVFTRKNMKTGITETLIDQNDLAKQFGFTHIMDVKASPNSRYVAFSLDITGSEIYDIYVIDTHADTKPTLVAKQTYSFDWLGDEHIMFATLDTHLQPNRAYICKLYSEEKPKLLYEETDPQSWVDVKTTKDGCIGMVTSVSYESTYVLYLRHFQDDPDRIMSQEPRELMPQQNGVIAFMEHANGYAYISTNGDVDDDDDNTRSRRDKFSIKRKKMMLMTSDDDDHDHDHRHHDRHHHHHHHREAWECIVSNDDDAHLDELDVFSRFLVLYERINALPRVRIVHTGAEKDERGFFPETILPLPCRVGCVTPLPNVEHDTDKVDFSFASSVLPDVHCSYNVVDDSMSILTSSVKAEKLFTSRCNHEILGEVILTESLVNIQGEEIQLQQLRFSLPVDKDNDTHVPMTLIGSRSVGLKEWVLNADKKPMAPTLLTALLLTLTLTLAITLTLTLTLAPILTLDLVVTLLVMGVMAKSPKLIGNQSTILYY